jgi:hypothetical protein
MFIGSYTKRSSRDLPKGETKPIRENGVVPGSERVAKRKKENKEKIPRDRIGSGLGEDKSGDEGA